MFLYGRKQIIFGRLVEDVVDYLDRVDQAAGDHVESRIGLMVVDGDSGEADLAVPLEIFKRALPFVAVNPAGSHT